MYSVVISSFIKSRPTPIAAAIIGLILDNGRVTLV